LSAPRFYRAFGSLESFCEKAGVKLDKETLKRMKETARATRRHAKKSVKKAVATHVEKPTPESKHCEQRTPTFELMQEDLATEREAHESRKERAQQFAHEMKILALNGDPEISDPIVDALCFEVLPTVLEREFGVSFTLEELCQAELTLRQVQEERERLHEKELELDGYAKKVEAERLQVQKERQRIEAIPDKAELQKQIERLLAWNKTLADRNEELYQQLQQSKSPEKAPSSSAEK
jgi:hypothetical protein